MNNRETAKFSKEIKINEKDNLENITQYLLELEQNSKLFDEKIQKLNKLNDINNDNNEGNILELETKEIDTDNSLLDNNNTNINSDNLKNTFNPFSNNAFQSMMNLDNNYDNEYNELKKKIEQCEKEISYKDELINELKLSYQEKEK